MSGQTSNSFVQPAKRGLAVTLLLAPCALALFVMVRYWVPVPYWDEWSTPADQLIAYYRGTLSFSDLWSQHNESRKFFPRLLYLLVIPAAGWDVRYFMVLTFALVCLASAGLYLLLRATIHGGSLALPAAWGTMNLLLFSPGEYWNFLLGIQLEPFTPAVALLFAMLINLSSWALRWKTCACAALALLSTYTFANGMLLWVLATPILFQTAQSGGKRTGNGEMLLCYAAYAAAALLAIGCYFISYAHPPLSPEWVSPLGDPLPLIIFLLTWIGSLFLLPGAALTGAAVLVLFAVLGTIAVRIARRQQDWRTFYPWLALGCYTVLSGGITALARLRLAPEAASHPRYGAFTVWLYIAVTGLAWTVWEGTRERRIARALVLALVAAVVLLFGCAFRPVTKLLASDRAHRQHLLQVMRWSPVIPENPELRFLSPYPATAEKIRMLYSLDVLRPKAIPASLLEMVQAPPATDDAAAGRLDRAVIDHLGQLTIEGRTRSPARDAASDAVVIGYESAGGTWTPYLVLDPAHNPARNASQKDSAFRRVITGADLPTGAITFRAWSVDLHQERVFPMHSIALQRVAP